MISKAIAAAVAVIVAAAMLYLLLIAIKITAHLTYLAQAKAATVMDALVVAAVWVVWVGLVYFIIPRKNDN